MFSLEMYNKVLVTGGSGFVGKSIQRLRPNWIYMSSKDCDITDKDSFYEYLLEVKPDAIIHLAARVGGIKEAAQNQGEFLYLNTLINLNIIHQAHKAGIKRVLSCLSTCCFPDISDSYPMTEEDLMRGEPTKTNYGYAYAKRVLYLQSKYYSDSHGVIYNTFTPSNIYGMENCFDSDKSHFVSSMVRKFYDAKDGDTITFWGSGRPLRQHLYVNDLADIVVKLLHLHETNLPLIVSPDENLSIKEHIDICKNIVNKDIKISYNGHLDGQFRKDASNKRLLDLLGGYNFTPFEDGLRHTLEWYKKHREEK
tara:strand:+ start:279 stop:1205 length:927 start_codon:yes stop_codon:yes gene_type:complete